MLFGSNRWNRFVRIDAWLKRILRIDWGAPVFEPIHVRASLAALLDSKVVFESMEWIRSNRSKCALDRFEVVEVDGVEGE